MLGRGFSFVTESVEDEGVLAEEAETKLRIVRRSTGDFVNVEFRVALAPAQAELGRGTL